MDVGTPAIYRYSLPGVSADTYLETAASLYNPTLISTHNARNCKECKSQIYDKSGCDKCLTFTNKNYWLLLLAFYEMRKSLCPVVISRNRCIQFSFAFKLDTTTTECHGMPHVSPYLTSGDSGVHII